MPPCSPRHKQEDAIGCDLKARRDLFRVKRKHIVLVAHDLHLLSPSQREVEQQEEKEEEEKEEEEE